MSEIKISSELNTARLILDKKLEIVRDAFRKRGGYPSPLDTAQMLEKVVVDFNEATVKEKDVMLVLVTSLILADQFCVYELDLKTIKSLNSNNSQSLDWYNVTREVLELVDCYEHPELSQILSKSHNLQELISKILLDLAKYLNKNDWQLDAFLQPEIIKKYFPPPCSVHDHCINETVDAFLSIQAKTACPFAPKTKYWGAPSWQESMTEQENWKLIIPDFRRFLIIGKKERFDAYLVAAPGFFSKSVEDITSFFARSLEILNANDSKKSNCLKENIESPKWSYEFEGDTMFISVFGVCYDKSNPRHTWGQPYTFFFFQPNYTLRSHPALIGDQEIKTKKHIMKLFDSANTPFSNKDADYEAARYVRSMTKEEKPVKWWRYLSHNSTKLSGQ